MIDYCLFCKQPLYELINSYSKYDLMEQSFAKLACHNIRDPYCKTVKLTLEYYHTYYKSYKHNYVVYKFAIKDFIYINNIISTFSQSIDDSNFFCKISPPNGKIITLNYPILSYDDAITHMMFI